MKTIFITATIDLIINMDEDSDINKVMEELDYSFMDTTGTADVVDTEIIHYDITNCK